VLHAFAGGTSDGGNPFAGLIADSSGNFYGTATIGGSSGAGVVFKLSPNGTPAVLHSFAGGASDGGDPESGLIADSSGNLYGTTRTGGGSGCFTGQGCGTVFRLSPDGTSYTVLHSFVGGASDGAVPVAGLILDSSGNLYGTTAAGGGSGCGGFGCGVVFKLSPSGTVTLLHSFTGSDGTMPRAGLITDSNGNLYGTTQNGGDLSCGPIFGQPGCGVVFKLSPSGTTYTFSLLHTFEAGASDGAIPLAGLIADSSGNLYSTTDAGGGSGCGGTGCGGVFKLSPSGSSYTFSLLYSFAGPPSDGWEPFAGLILDGSGNLYGTTQLGGGAGCGAPGCGVVFKVSPSGTETVLYAFAGGAGDGAEPVAGLIADSSGNLYGMTEAGGGSGAGVVFELAGTGFVTTTPFLAFSAKLEIGLDNNPAKDTFAVESSFTLSSSAPPINPTTQPVTLSIGPFTTTIPPGGAFTTTILPGSFQPGPLGTYNFEGVVNGVQLAVSIAPTGTLRYAFAAGALGANLTGTANPVPVSLTIGQDSGTASVKPFIVHY
jgi:uncharacterized repeat protein (TIGR03803 family)